MQRRQVPTSISAKDVDKDFAELNLMAEQPPAGSFVSMEPKLLTVHRLEILVGKLCSSARVGKTQMMLLSLLMC